MTLPLMFAACTDKTEDDTLVQALDLTTLAGDKLGTITLSDNASIDFKVSARPATAVLKGSDFNVRLTAGGSPDYIKFSVKKESPASVVLTVTDDGTFSGAQPYRHSVVVEHKPTGVVSEPFIVTRHPKQQQSQFSLSLETVPEALRVGETAELTLKVSPETEVLEGDNFTLLTDKNAASKYVKLEYVDNADGLYTFNIRDIRTAYEEYSEVLKVVYKGEQPVASQTFTLASASSFKVSKLYITLENGLTRQKDLDSKTTAVNGYNENGTNFENHVKVDNRNWVEAKVRIEGADGFKDLEEMATNIKGRGNSTWNWAKKPYNLKLDSKAEVLGMKKHKRWCLIANAIDRTHLRNWLAYNISRQMSFDYAIHGEFVELYFIENGKEDYRGLYFLTEHIKEDKDARVPLTEVKESKTGVEGDQIGFLLEFDMNYDEPGRFLTTTSRLPVNIKYPAQEDWEAAGNMDQYNKYKNYISGYVSEIDKMINELPDGGNSEELWKKLDIESMANFWIVFETMSCREILWPKSIYFHKEVGEKLKAGPTWDFDYRTLNASDASEWINHLNAKVANTNTQYWAKKSSRTWWAQLIKKDATFRAEVKKQWAVIYPKMQAIQSTEIDKMKSLLKEADEHNATVWKQSDIGSNPNTDNAMTFDNAVNTLKTNFNTRIQWLNTKINNW